MANTTDQYPTCPICGDHRLKRLAEDKHTFHCHVGCGHTFHESAAVWHDEAEPVIPLLDEQATQAIAPHVHYWYWKFNWRCTCGMYSFAGFEAMQEERTARAYKPLESAEQLIPGAVAMGLTNDEYRAQLRQQREPMDILTAAQHIGEPLGLTAEELLAQVSPRLRAGA